LIALGQLFLCLLDGGGHSEAETTAVVDFNLQQFNLKLEIRN
jgi:hypothetical protein